MQRLRAGAVALLVQAGVLAIGCGSAPNHPPNDPESSGTTVTVTPPAAGGATVAEPVRTAAVPEPAPPSKPVAGSGADRDGDGIVDARDKCPDDPEDRDGFEDEDGCPDPDNDRDGILDVQDKCPNEPETKNGFHDEDGCPDKKP